MRFLLYLLLCLPQFGSGQELPPVINFSPSQYQAGNQNWMISQAANHNIYVANSSGLLEYTGAEWKLYPMPNNSVVRSLKVVGDKIFTGAYMEIGYWITTNTGLLEYTSLTKKFPEEIKDGEQFWHIEAQGEVVIFQSLEGIYLYNMVKDEISQVPTPSLVINLFKGENSVYYQVTGEGLFTIHNNQPDIVIPPGFLEQIEIKHVAQRGSNLHLISRTGNFYSWNGKDLVQEKLDLSEKIKNKSIFSALSMADNSLILGTVENGIYYIDKDGEILLNFNQENGLINNTVLELFQDSENNIWTGLDNGLGIINLDSPVKLYRDLYGRLGSVYASYQNDQYLYLGTNQGLFVKENTEETFRLIEGTNGQVWSLQFLDGYLFCGHNNGTFIIENEKASKVYDLSGTWTVINYPNNPGYYLQGHYNGISLLKEENGVFEFVGTVEKFPHSSKFVIAEEDGSIWVGNEHKGVFKFALKGTEPVISSIYNYSFNETSGITSSIFKFNDTLYYSAKEKLYQYRETDDKFVDNSKLAGLFEKEELISGRVVNAGDDKIWGFSGQNIFSIELAQLSTGYRMNAVNLPNESRNITPGYENINYLMDGSYLLGISNGYLKFNNSSSQLGGYKLRIDKVRVSALDEEPQPLSLNEAGAFHYKANNIFFNYSIPEYKKFVSPVYSFRLLGLSPNWSAWDANTATSFTNLRYGSYEFEVRARIGDYMIPPARYGFEISRPWYLSNTAIIVYVLLFLALLLLVHKAYKRKHLKLIRENEKELKMKNLEAEKKIIELQKEQLEKDMAGKNKELAISTMSLIKKNEFLTSIKDSLKNSKESDEIRSVIKTIDKDINEEDNWNFFKEAFNNADKDFFKKIKIIHPNLTSNDLKLCAYLRLNLSSKEIAPLLNISTKSVEIKRYRLRKKMDLPREENLTDYILQV